MANDLKHYGTKRHSGRYPWGSGEDPNQHTNDFLSTVSQLRKEGLSKTEIAQAMGMKNSELQFKISNAKNEKRKIDAAKAQALKDKGYSNVAIGENLGINESSVRALLDPELQERAQITSNIANVLRTRVGEVDYLDIGSGTEIHLGVSRTKLDAAVDMLKEEGYQVFYIKEPQLGTDNFTSIRVLAKEGVPYSDVYSNRDKVRLLSDYSEDGGRTILGIEPPRNISSDRIAIRYNEEGGLDKDGVIEIRRGVDDISLGSSKYAQVRVGVDGTHYLKGMAMYSDDIPDGFDIVYNTKKPKGVPKEEVFKSVKDDADNPFGSVVRQRHYINAEGKSELSALNIVNEEGDWFNWSRTISSQVLSKQRPSLAKQQLEIALELKKNELEEIQSLTNPAVKRRLLDAYADGCDSAAVHLKAAALPRQGNYVILPFPKMKENEVYAPNFKQGESVVLIRHPHGGTFEIPELIVNNKNPHANSAIKGAKDAIGIHPKVAAKLSGADFDGDTVLVIPNPAGAIRTSPSLKGLQDFDPISSYPKYPGMAKMSDKSKQAQMGNVSNLITDMTIKGATADEICRAVKHSMVVIDAQKHELNYKLSALDNRISELKEKYQGGKRSGSSTLISRASSEVRVPKRKDRGTFTTKKNTDPLTGKRIFEETGEEYTITLPDKKGPYSIDHITGEKVYLNTKTKRVGKTTKIPLMDKVDNAYELSSGTRMEAIYAEHANALKSLANSARKTSLNTKDIAYSPSAKNVYAKEVESLKAKLRIAYRNKPLERQAQLVANKIVRLKKEANPGLEPTDIKKLKSQALDAARSRTGAKKQNIQINDKEWEAIQSGALQKNTLARILLNTDLDALKERALPREARSMTSAKIARGKQMLKAGYTQAEVAEALGISTSTLLKALD